MAAREAASQTAATATMARSRTTHSAPPSSSFRRHDRRVKNEFLLRSREPASFFLLRCQQSRIHRPGSPPLRPLEGSPSFGCLSYPVHLCIQLRRKISMLHFPASFHLRSRNSNRHPPEALVFFRVKLKLCRCAPHSSPSSALFAPRPDLYLTPQLDKRRPCVTSQQARCFSTLISRPG